MDNDIKGVFCDFIIRVRVNNKVLSKLLKIKQEIKNI